MYRTAIAAAALATLAAIAPAHAERDAARAEYDRSIDAAAARIVAGKMGELRGGFDYRTAPKMTPAVDRQSTGSVPLRWEAGLAPAAELVIVVPAAL